MISAFGVVHDTEISKYKSEARRKKDQRWNAALTGGSGAATAGYAVSARKTGTLARREGERAKGLKGAADMHARSSAKFQTSNPQAARLHNAKSLYGHGEALSSDLKTNKLRLHSSNKKLNAAVWGGTTAIGGLSMAANSKKLNDRGRVQARAQRMK